MATKEKKPEKVYKVTIGLYRDKYVKNIEMLALDHPDGHGHRLTGTKASGQWDLIRKLECSLTLSLLKEYTKKEKKDGDKNR